MIDLQDEMSKISFWKGGPWKFVRFLDNFLGYLDNFIYKNSGDTDGRNVSDYQKCPIKIFQHLF